MTRRTIRQKCRVVVFSGFRQSHLMKAGLTDLVAADVFAANILPVVRQIQAAGATTRRAVASALNARGIHTARGGAWHDSIVRNLLARAVRVQ